MKKIFLLSFVLLNKNCFSQEISTLENVNITNSRSFQKNSISGKNITIIDGSMFEKLPILSIDELLKYSAGVETQQRGPAGSQADIIIRGGTFQQVLILMDGMKLNDPITGHFSGYIPITPSEIARIEIIKGPAAAIYGSEAVGGVINIISKTFINKETSTKEKFEAIVGFGEFGLLNAHSGYHKKNNKYQFNLGALSNNAEGQLLRSGNRGYFRNNTFSGSYSSTIRKKWQFMIHSSLDYRDFSAENFYTTFKSDTAIEKIKTLWNHAKLKKTTNKKTDEIDFVFKSSKDYYLYNPSSTANENNSSIINLQYAHHGILSSNFNFLYGLMVEQKNILSNDRGNHSNNHAALFGSSSIQLNKLNFNPGIRFIADENYGFNFLPQLNASIPFERILFRGGVGKAIRAADFTERYNNFNKPLVRGGSIGNPDLTAEKSLSYEVGMDFSSKHFRISGTSFYRDQNQLIDFVNTAFKEIPRNQNLDSNGQFSFAKNIKSVNTKGLEFEINYFLKLKKMNFSFNNAFLLLDSKTSDSIPSYYILSHAKLLIQQRINLTYNKTDINITSVYKERNPQTASSINAITSRSYWLMNLKIQHHLNKFCAFIGVNNIGDINYSDLLGSKMPGRWTSGGISFKF